MPGKQGESHCGMLSQFSVLSVWIKLNENNASEVANLRDSRNAEMPYTT